MIMLASGPPKFLIIKMSPCIYYSAERAKGNGLSWGLRVFPAVSVKGTFIVNSGPSSTRESVSLFWGPWALPEYFCGLPAQVLAFYLPLSRANCN